MPGDLALVDSNVLVYSVYQDSPHHGRCRALLEKERAGDLALCVAPQNLAEFYAVVTDPHRVDVPRRPAEALDAIERFLAMPGMSLLPVPSEMVAQWLVLTRGHPVTRGAVFDVQLAATMLGNGVRKIYTINESDFHGFDEIEVPAP